MLGVWSNALTPTLRDLAWPDEKSPTLRVLLLPILSSRGHCFSADLYKSSIKGPSFVDFVYY